MKLNTLPENWVSVSLNDICAIEMGQSPPSNTYNNQGDGLPFFQGKAEFNDLYPTIKKWCNRPNKIVEKDTILISVRAPVGPTNIAPDRCCIGRGLAGLTPYSGVSNRFVLYSLRALEHQLSSMGAGSTFDAIASSDLRNFKIPLAPVNEQARILQKIEEQISRLDFAISGLNRIKTNLKRYRASVLQAAVEGRLTAEWRKQNPPSETGAELLARILKKRRAKWEENQLKKYAEQGKTPPKNWKEKYPEPVKPDITGLPELPEGWVWCTVGQVAKVGTGATPLKANKNYYNEGDIPWVTSGALNKPFVFEAAATYITELAIKETNACVYPKGTLLVAMYGEGKTRGKVSELGFPAAVNQACAAIVFSEESEKVKPFIKTFFQKAYEDIRLLSSGGVQPNLNLGHIMETKIPLPPIQEQQEVIQQLALLFSVTDTTEKTVESALQRAARLRQSILKRAFEGRLVPQDPNDEPANVLLERIRAERVKQAATVKPARAKSKVKGHAG